MESSINIDFKFVQFVVSSIDRGGGGYFKNIIKTLTYLEQHVHSSMAFPVFTQLIDCAPTWYRSYRYYTGMTLRAFCPSFFRSNLRECKKTGLDICMCLISILAYGFQILNPGNVVQVLSVMQEFLVCCVRYILLLGLRDMASAIEDQQSMIRKVFGKTVHLVKMTDNLRLVANANEKNVKHIDETLKAWRIGLLKQNKAINCVTKFTAAF